MKTKTQKNNETTKQSSKIKKKNKLSKLARVFIVIGLVLAVAGVALGIYFLVRTPGKDPDDAPNLTPEQQQWVDAIVD